MLAHNGLENNDVFLDTIIALDGNMGLKSKVKSLFDSVQLRLNGSL